MIRQYNISYKYLDLSVVDLSILEAGFKQFSWSYEYCAITIHLILPPLPLVDDAVGELAESGSMAHVRSKHSLENVSVWVYLYTLPMLVTLGYTALLHFIDRRLLPHIYRG